jgi:hypothetical protein
VKIFRGLEADYIRKPRGRNATGLEQNRPFSQIGLQSAVVVKAAFDGRQEPQVLATQKRAKDS